jgi:NADH dehydrogenase/NADH:ubiquinone oxidoreductase subunit G
MPKVTVDGLEIEVTQGATVLQARKPVFLKTLEAAE